MTDQNPETTIKTLTTIIGFVGVLLAILTNAATSITNIQQNTTILGTTIHEIPYIINTTLSFTVYLLITCILMAFSILTEIPVINRRNNQEKSLELTYKFLLAGLTLTAISAILIIYNSTPLAPLYAVIFSFIVVITLKKIDSVTKEK